MSSGLAGVDVERLPESLAPLKKVVESCSLCELSATRNNVVFGGDNTRARVMILGEAPGKNEDMSGKPFVGAAGKKLASLLEIAGLMREDVYICNILKCRPPRNRNPKVGEIAACTPYLVRQIEIVKPQIIVCLGNFATHFALGTTRPITDLRGQIVELDSFAQAEGKRAALMGHGLFVLPVFHPAAALYDGKKQAILEQDFALLRTWLAQNGDRD